MHCWVFEGWLTRRKHGVIKLRGLIRWGHIDIIVIIINVIDTFTANIGTRFTPAYIIINISTIYDSNNKSLTFHHIFINSDWCIHTLFCQLEFRFFFGTPKCTLPTFSGQCTKLQCTNIVHCTTLLNQAASAPSPQFKALLLARHKPSHAVHNTNVQCGWGHWKPGKHYTLKCAQWFEIPPHRWCSKTVGSLPNIRLWVIIS